jgi:organic hydroperoxide reductase OsmC/OhrA
MSEHHAGVEWDGGDSAFTYETYSRSHRLLFKGGRVQIDASAAPAFRGDADRVDPEEAFVASLASCHMLSFLAICARKRLPVDAYTDNAVGHLEKGEHGKLWIARVVLRPRVTFAPAVAIAPAERDALHHRAHDECFLANSVRTEILVQPGD